MTDWTNINCPECNNQEAEITVVSSKPGGGIACMCFSCGSTHISLIEGIWEKTKHRLSIEAIADLQSFHNVNIKDQIKDIMNEELGKIID